MLLNVTFLNELNHLSKEQASTSLTNIFEQTNT